jgi:hypothetical protein
MYQGCHILFDLRTIKLHILDTYAGKQLSIATTDI